jgi:hypothetical protein
MARQEFDAAQRKTKELLTASSAYRGELVDEVVRLNLLDSEITNAIVAKKTAESEKQLERQGYERRVDEIAKLVADKAYPEAKRLGQSLIEDPGVPGDLSERAAALIAQADAELKKIWADTEFGETESEVQIEKKKKKRDGGS